MNLKRILAMMLCLCLMLACVPVVGVPVQATTEKQYVTIEAENTEYAVWNRYTKVESNAMYSGGAAAAGAPSGIYPYWDNASDSTEDLSANFLDKSNTPYVAYYVEAPADGTYSIKMKAQILPSSSVDKRFEDTGLYYGAFYVNGKSYPALYANSTDYANSVKGKNLTTQETQVELVKGMNTIICVGITEEQDYNSSNSCWSNIDCLMVEDSLTPVKTQENIIYAGDAPYVYGYTTVNAGANVGDGGWGDNTIPISNMSTSNVEKLRSFTYTMNAPQNGYYDITAEYDGAGNGSDTRAIGLLIDGTPYAYEFKHLDNTNTSGGRVNLGVYLTAGDHVLTFTAPAKRTAEDDCGTGDASTTKNVSWFNYNEIYLYGGLTKSVIQSNPKLDWWYAEAEYKDEGYALWHTYNATENNTDAKRDYNGANYPDNGKGKVIGGGNTIYNPALATLQQGILDKSTVSGVTIYVDAPAAGTYSFKARYRLNNPGIWDSTNKTWTEDPYSVFMINGKFGAQSFFDKAAQYNWTYDTYSTELTLKEGVNEITFIPMTADQRKSGSDWVNVDCIFVDTDLQVVTVDNTPVVDNSVRLEAENGVIGRYTNTTEAGKSGTVVGGINRDTSFMQTFADLQANGLTDKSGIAYVSYMVDVPEAGEYTLRSVYRVAMTSGYEMADYYMTASVNDKAFYQMAYAPYESETNGWAESEIVVQLEKGYNVIRMISVNADNNASVSWLNQDYIEIDGNQKVTAVTQTANIFQSGEAAYNNGYTTVNSGSYDCAKSFLGGIEKTAMTYDMLDYTTIKELGWVSYTLEIPADGYYDMHTSINTGAKTQGYIIMVIDGVKHKMPVAEVAEGFKMNKQNLTTYLTKGTHTILISALCESGATWCDMGALTVYGEGVKLAETQIDPITYMQIPEGLVEGSIYVIENGTITIGTNVNVLTLKSNFHGNVTVSDSEGNALADEAIVPDGAVVSYASGTSYTVHAVDTMDKNSDGKIDIRDLKIVNEKQLAGEDCSAELASIKASIFAGGKSYQATSIGADAMLAYCNPVGRPTKVGNALYLEPSASNFTMTGEFAGDVFLTVMHSQGINDRNEPGLFVQIDGGEGVYFDLDTFYTKQTLKIASGLEAGEHTIAVSKSVDSKNGGLYIYSASFNGKLTNTAEKTRKIHFVGDSITSGFGVVTKSYDPLGIVTDGVYTNKTYSYYSYANVVADTLNADYYSISNGGWYFSSSESADIENKSITRIYDEQSMLIELGAYDHSVWQPDVVVINLGTNDATLKDADGNLVVTAEQYMTDVAVMIDQVRAANPNAKIIWAYGAMGDTSNMPEGGLEDWIIAAIESYNADKEAAMQVTYVTLPTYQNGLWSHPNVDGQQAIGEALASEIAALMGWN